MALPLIGQQLIKRFCRMAHGHAGIDRSRRFRRQLQILQHETDGKPALIAIVGGRLRTHAG